MQSYRLQCNAKLHAVFFLHHERLQLFETNWSIILNLELFDRCAYIHISAQTLLHYIICPANTKLEKLQMRRKLQLKSAIAFHMNELVH